jgi:hypothetical protein
MMHAQITLNAVSRDDLSKVVDAFASRDRAVEVSLAAGDRYDVSTAQSDLRFLSVEVRHLHQLLESSPASTAPSGDTDDFEAENGRWVTAGELIAHLSRYPADMPITASKPDGDWFNIIGATDPNETGEESVILITRDDFDTRQW